MPKNSSRDTHKAQKLLLPQPERAKNHLNQRKPLKKNKKLRKKSIFFQKMYPISLERNFKRQCYNLRFLQKALTIKYRQDIQKGTQKRLSIKQKVITTQL